MPASTDRSPSRPPSPRSSTSISRRELLAGASAGAAALFLEPGGAQAQPAPGSTVVFAHTTVVTVDAARHDVALAVEGGTIAAIGPTDQVLKKYPQAEVYDGRGKALFPGLINCHAHLGATIARGFNEDFGFPNSYRLAVQPNSLLSREEATLMAVVGALEAIKTGSTTVVENVSGTASTATALAATGLRWVFAESATDREGGAPMSPDVARRVVKLFREFRPPERAPSQLTPQETELLKLLVEGHHYKTAADELSISTNTVSFHLKNIYTKLQVHSKTEAIARALRDHLV